MLRLSIIVLLKFAVWAGLVAAFLADGSAFAQGRFLSISLTGAYAENTTKNSQTYRKSWGAELGLPLTSFFEVSLGHTFVEDITIYNDEYRELLEDRGYPLPEGRLTATQRIQDYSANGSLGYSIRSIRPSIFGGALRRKVCQEDFLEDHGCEMQNLTWNAGVALSVYVTWSLRLKASHRISPSVHQVSGEKRKFDELTSVGLEWSL